MKRTAMKPGKGMKRAYRPLNKLGKRGREAKKIEDAWKATQKIRCWVCHLRPGQRNFMGDIQLHHLKLGKDRTRKADPRVFTLLCERDHQVAEGERIIWNGGSRFLPEITPQMLWALKLSNDPDNYDAAIAQHGTETLATFYLLERRRYT